MSQLTLEELQKEENDDLEAVQDESELEIDEGASRQIIWQAKDFTIREFVSMEQDGELDLQPKYQRKFVATSRIASKLIESVLMDVPIPVIY